MKKIIILMIVAIPYSSFSQSMLERFKQKVKTRVEQRVDEGMDKTIDKAEEEVNKKPGSKEEKSKEPEEQVAKTAIAKAEKPAVKQEEKQTATSLQSFSRYDFVPGENVVYAEDFSQDVIGEFPLKWSTSNRGETVNIEKTPGKWLRMFEGQFVSPVLNKLPENFTAEFDLVLTQYNKEVENFGWGYPKIEMQLLQLPAGQESARKYAQNSNEGSVAGIVIQPASDQRSSIRLYTAVEKTYYFENEAKDLKKLNEYYSKPFHVAMWVQKQRLRVWINGDKVYDIPQAISPDVVFNCLGFHAAGTSNEGEVGMYVSNIKVAQGTPDMRSKLITEGKFVTSGILFDVSSDNIKPESSGVLKEIASVLKENATIKVKVIGHTDSDGVDANNLELSKRRAASVKSALAKEFGIDASRLETDGLGETKPVADNKTKEGKAQNRRVEFIKL